MGIVVIVISSPDNGTLSSPLNFFLFRNMREVKIQTYNEVVEKSRMSL